ncbi:unnamed protein product [Lampetra fluviatilis]
MPLARSLLSPPALEQTQRRVRRRCSAAAFIPALADYAVTSGSGKIPSDERRAAGRAAKRGGHGSVGAVTPRRHRLKGNEEEFTIDAEPTRPSTVRVANAERITAHICTASRCAISCEQQHGCWGAEARVKEGDLTPWISVQASAKNSICEKAVLFSSAREN